MKHSYFLTMLLAAMSVSAYGITPLAEPDASLLASGKWVKVRVESDGIYELTHEKLRELGFSNPENVGVYGYSPVILLSHDLSKMPVDMTPVQTLHADGKLLFYGKSNVDYAPELWQTRLQNCYDSQTHQRHAFSTGATYFLSDSPAANTTFASVTAPDDETDARTIHTAVEYIENDVQSLSEGGAWLSDIPLGGQVTSMTHNFTVNNVATGNGRVVYQSLLSPAENSNRNFLLATFPESFTVEAFDNTDPSHGFVAGSTKSDAHDYFKHSIRYQKITLPVEDDAKTYDVTFSIHPEAAQQTNPCALDYFALLYDRKNSLEGQNQVHMYFENWEGAQTFQLSGNDFGNWQVWNVTNPANITRLELSNNGVGALSHAEISQPTEVIAFNTAATQLSPEIIGKVENQNLHAETTPDMLIIAPAVLMESAEEIAELHRRHNDMTVLVVEQFDIFNEYGSGNTSPEAVRRFIRHLYYKNPGKLAGVLLLGPGTDHNALHVTPNDCYLVCFQMEDYKWCNNTTRSAVNDSFFGHISSEFAVGSLWNSRTLCIRLLGSEQLVPIGRLPLTSNTDIRKYYSKVKEYLTTPPTYPAWGNIMLFSDLAKASEKSHFADAETMVNSLAEINVGVDSVITVTRGAYNYYTGAGVVPKMFTNQLMEGAMFLAYYGHGNRSSFGGTQETWATTLFDVNAAKAARNIGRYPFGFFGSCSVAPFDLGQTGVYPSMLANELGGLIGFGAAARAVYQPMNRRLGAFFASSLYSAEDGDFIGKIWMKAYNQAVCQKDVSVQDILNHLDYNYIGDPMLPIYAPTHSARITNINGEIGAIRSLASNVIEGEILDADGHLDTHFSGSVLLTVYDTPAEFNNHVGANAANEHLGTKTMDSESIGQFVGSAANGKFTVNFYGPVAPDPLNHRIQVYAYSADGRKRGYGAEKGVTLTYDAETEEEPTGAPTAITEFIAGSGNPDEYLRDETIISATISAPKGLGNVSSVIKPIRLAIDGDIKTEAYRCLNRKENGEYTFRFATMGLGGGRHQATLSVLDAAGVWTDAELEFSIDNSPIASLNAEISDGSITFELNADDDQTERVLVIESLNGEKLRAIDNPTFPLAIDLNPGLYRAYVRMRGKTSMTATPKVDILVH